MLRKGDSDTHPAQKRSPAQTYPAFRHLTHLVDLTLGNSPRKILPHHHPLLLDAQNYSTETCPGVQGLYQLCAKSCLSRGHSPSRSPRVQGCVGHSSHCLPLPGLSLFPPDTLRCKDPHKGALRHPEPRVCGQVSWALHRSSPQAYPLSGSHSFSSPSLLRGPFP